jgi:hypothetical protein
MTLNPELARIVSAFWTAFPDTPPPTLDRSSPWPEVADAAREIEGFSWRTAPGPVLDAVHDALPWLDAESFVYWLPGLLLDLMVAPSRASTRGDALVLALTPPDASDLADDRRTLDRSRDDGLFDEATHTAAVEQITAWHQRLRTPLFESRWNRLTPAQQATTRDALEYLAREYARADATEAVARWHRGMPIDR